MRNKSLRNRQGMCAVMPPREKTKGKKKTHICQVSTAKVLRAQ